MIGRIYEFADLKRLTHYERRADVESYLQRLKIRYFPSRGGPWTTEAAINEALGIQAAGSNDAAYNPDELL